MVDRKRELSIPIELFSEIQRQVEKTQFRNVDEYATFILEEATYYADESNQDLSVVTDEEIKTRLKSLGYLEDE